MKKNKHALTPVWDKYPEVFATETIPVDYDALMLQLFKFFTAADHYHYVIDTLTQLLTHQHEDICSIHGLDRVPTHLQQIIDLIHPDDLSFVMQAEDYCYGKVLEIGVEHIPSLKSAYCFRMRVADGSYHLFHHQAITILPDGSNRIARSLNIHSDIQHISKENSYIATIMGIQGRSDFHQMDLSTKTLDITPVLLTRRQRELLPFIAKGHPTADIARHFGISVETVRKHRQQMLRKTQSSNSAALIKKCLELGYI